MDLLFVHTQNKKDRKSPAVSNCDLKVFGDEQSITYSGVFDLDYARYGTRKHITFEHSFSLSLITGDFDITYKITNENLTEENIYKNSYKMKRNDFSMLNDLIDNGFYRGEKRLHYWGVKYERAINEICLIITNKLKPKLTSEFYVNKSYKEKPTVNELYDLLVDYHLNQKNIKGHDNVYFDIMDLYPPKKYLKLNDNKFLPAVLDWLKIKSKFLVKELNSSELPINIVSLNYLCKLFGDNHLDYLKKINWKTHCIDTMKLKLKCETLRNDVEKNSFIKMINNWNKTSTNLDNVFICINKLLKLRRDLESIGVVISLTPKNDNQYNNMIEKLTNLKRYYQRGFKLKYVFPKEFLNEIQKDIMIGEEIFKVRVLLSEEDYIYEGYHMKNCMSKQFTNGLLYVYLRGSIKNKHINLQYRKGQLVQSYGKSNTPIPSIFLPFIDLLNDKFKHFNELKWFKEKYDFITN